MSPRKHRRSQRVLAIVCVIGTLLGLKTMASTSSDSTSPCRVLIEDNGRAPRGVAGEIRWPGADLLKGTALCWQFRDRSTMVGNYDLVLLGEDGPVLRVANYQDLARYVDWDRVAAENSYLSLAFLVVGIKEITRVVEFSASVEEATSREEPFYGCKPVSEKLAKEWKDVDVEFGPMVSRRGNRAIVRFACIYSDLADSIWFHEVDLSPQSVLMQSSRSGFRLEAGLLVADDGRYGVR